MILGLGVDVDVGEGEERERREGRYMVRAIEIGRVGVQCCEEGV